MIRTVLITLQIEHDGQEMSLDGQDQLIAYLERLRATRLQLVADIQPAPLLFHLEQELPSGRVLTSNAYRELEAELAAIAATKWFRLRESLVGTVRGKKSKAGYPQEPRQTLEPTEPSATIIGDYDAWVREVDELHDLEMPFVRVALENLHAGMSVGLVVFMDDQNIIWLPRFLDSAASQVDAKIQIKVCLVCVGDALVARELISGTELAGEVLDVPAGSSVVEHLNHAVSRLESDWVGFFDASDVLARHAMATLALTLDRHPTCELIYSDEDRISSGGTRHEPHFKPDWNPMLLLGIDYLESGTWFKRSRLESLGGVRTECGDGWRWDLHLRYSEELGASAIVHVPYVLVHRHTVDHLSNLAPVVASALERRGVAGKATDGRVVGTVIVAHQLESTPLVSIIIPTRDHVDLLRACIDSICKLTDYPAYEFVIVDNGSSDAAALHYLEELRGRGNFRVVRDASPFNYSTLNNKGAFYANGEVLALINNDLEVFDPGWMRQMTALATLPESGVVGCLLLYPDHTIQHGGVVVGFSRSLAAHSFQFSPVAVGGYLGRAVVDQYVSAVTGACMFVRKSVFEAIGGLDEEQFAVTYNDIDLCLKTRHLGYENIYAGSVGCIHHESKSRGKDATRERELEHVDSTARLSYRWGAGYEDRYYNPNLSYQHPNYRLSFAPRVHRPWYR